MAKKTKRSPIFGKIWAVCYAGGTLKRVIRNVLIRGGKMIATDEYIIAVRNIPEDSALNGKEALIPAALAKKLAKETDVSLVGNEVKTPNAIYPIDTNGYTPMDYPHWEPVIPDPDTLTHLEVSLNADFLKRLADAISDNGVVTLRFSDDRRRAIHVRGNEGYGAIMPVRP